MQNHLTILIHIRHKNYIKETWSTINETLNRSKNNSDLPNEFRVDNRLITNPKKTANSFNFFFSTICTNMSSNVSILNTNLKFNDYLTIQLTTDLNFNKFPAKKCYLL